MFRARTPKQSTAFRRLGARCAFIALGSLLSIASANAATFSLAGTPDFVLALPGTYNPSGGPGGGPGPGTVVSIWASDSPGEGLTVSPGNVNLTFTYWGSEAAFHDLAFTFNLGATQIFDNQAGSNPDYSANYNLSSPYFVPIAFRTVDTGEGVTNYPNGVDVTSGTVAIAFWIDPSDPSTVFAFYEDIARGENADRDFDDLVVRIQARDIREVPLPASVLLMGSVLAGATGVGRWRKKRKAAARSVA